MEIKNYKLKLTIVVPAFNEEKNLEFTIRGLMYVLNEKRLENYEIIIFDDSSSDRTGIIADRLALENKGIKVIHNKINMGFGYNYKKGVEMSAGEYVMIIPGDNEVISSSFGYLIDSIGKADIVLSYIDNVKERSWIRRIISFFYVKFLNFLFSLNMKYYNGISIYPVSLVKKTMPTTFGFAFAAEIAIRLLKSGATYIEVPMFIRPTNKTSAFRLKNIISVMKTIIILFWSINIKKERAEI
ncbi:MAG: glycosyltransferase family 2 protein [Parcubacteria group bacterium]|nr:glycosyltransferase family 2 protein [Parcubacteria group bacterium]MCR4342521.1 glycosyltransferase family 2 protein [Patescibacteria group bacterium]